jgi:hypothetical protein
MTMSPMPEAEAQSNAEESSHIYYRLQMTIIPSFAIHLRFGPFHKPANMREFDRISGICDVFHNTSIAQETITFSKIA